MKNVSGFVKKYLLVLSLLVLTALGTGVNSLSVSYAQESNIIIIDEQNSFIEKQYDAEYDCYTDIYTTIYTKLNQDTNETYKTIAVTTYFYRYDGFEYELITVINEPEKPYNPEAEPTQTVSPTMEPTLPPVYIPTPCPVPEYPVYTDPPYYLPDDPNVIKATSTPENNVNVDLSVVSFEVKRVKSTVAKITWKRVKQASGYYILRSTSEDSGYKKIKTINGSKTTSYSNKKLKSGKVYYYKVQAFYKIGGNVYTTYMPDAKQVTTFKTQGIINKLKKLKKKYPDGRYWNHVGKNVKDNQDVTKITTKYPCNHDGSQDGISSTCNYYHGKDNVIGYQCWGYASLLSDKLFGNAKIKAHHSFSKAKVGDHVRYSGHSVLIIAKHKDYIEVTECNIGNTCIIKWGRKISRSALGYATYYTRY